MSDKPMRTLGAIVGVSVLFAFFPEGVAACPVCFDASAENRMAFLATAVFLSLMPLGMVGGAGLWIRKLANERQDDDPVDPNRPEP